MATDLERFVAANGRDSVKEVRRRIDAEGIRTSTTSSPRSPAGSWARASGDALGDDGAEGFPARLRRDRQPFTDRHGNYIGYGPEAAELVGVPEPETFEPVPWDSGSRASGARASATARNARTRARSSPPTAAGTSSGSRRSSKRRPGSTSAPAPSRR